MTYLSTPTRRPRLGFPALLSFRSLKGMLSLHRQRHALGALDQEQLKDIGISKEQATTEARRPAWDFPKLPT